MPPKATPSEFPTQTFATPADFEAFLEREHATAPGVYVKLAKKSSGIPSITAAEAVEVALCYGWIDGRANACDDAFWTVRYTPRRAKSIWSQKNVGTVSRLIEDGRMRPAGLAAIDAAKADGRWDRAYAGSATIVTPDDLKDALAGVPAAKAHWESMNKSDRYAALLRVETGTKNARSKRIQGIVQGLATGRRQGLRHFEPDFDSAGPEGCRHIINMPANIPSHTSSREAKRLDSFDKDGKPKTYNSGDSLVVTHLTTNPPVHCLYMAERTGSLIFSVLWSYVQE